ncbi:hypothetical protein J5N97_021315 [Dioscorea zingiberensis]|uniref:Uncharacterized protein n=1 Tax=Dioscorea zingiberensis TaxID=325984 RepID=A0A9D5CHD8_9LILI|nr:hypothetical protein J5N97_021315 [Dioscorea zingiberensis]
MLLCVLLSRRRAIVAHLGCWKRSSRVEPAANMADIASNVKPAEETAGNLAFWFAMSGPSRALYTIKEDESEGKDTEVEIAIDADDDDDDDEEMGFATPCASPEFFTPSGLPCECRRFYAV